jgi:hypothetical protein
MIGDMMIDFKVEGNGLTGVVHPGSGLGIARSRM